MATKIFHGAPGSYKSSTAMWFEILPALRSGRVVVTNLQGIKSIDVIQSELNEIFPESARLLRISIGNDSGLSLIRNFFHWLPIGAMIFLDEIQDIYPNDKSFKASDYDYKKEGFFDELLPVEFVELYHREQRQIKSHVDISDYQDDLGESLFDERDYLRYPRTLRECFMRHRHYNWDILLATPDIKEIAGFVRSVCEVAYSHSSKDAIPIPYYQRRPRILEHLPKSNGTKVDKNDIVTFKKVPLDVFKLYKSTATGKSTKSGAGQSPFTTKLVFGFAFIIAYILYMVFFFFDDGSEESDNKPVQNPTTKISQSQKIYKSNNQVPSKNPVSVSTSNSSALDAVSYRDSPVSAVIASSNFLGLPFGATEVYLTGVVSTFYSKHHIDRDYTFTLYKDKEALFTNSQDLLDMGYKILYKSNCLVELRSDTTSIYAYCEPTKIQSETDSYEAPVQVSTFNT